MDYPGLLGSFYPRLMASQSGVPVNKGGDVIFSDATLPLFRPNSGDEALQSTTVGAHST